MTDALAALEDMSAKVAALVGAVTKGRAKTLPIAVAQPLARGIGTAYFESVRRDLEAVQNRLGLTEELDFVVQSLLRLASAISAKPAYRKQLKELRGLILEANVDLMKARGARRLLLSETEKSILATLTSMLPHSAASYEQALRDLADGGRVSWRGTATELREVLRETMDHLAPDAQVMAAPGFQLEAGQERPTQRQKVRFILRARRSPSVALAVAESSLVTVDEAVASLARSTYARGSASTHAESSAMEIRNLKRYVDAVLGELLEVK